MLGSSAFNKFRQEFNCLKGYRENHWYIELQNRFRSIEEYQKHIQINPFDTSTPLKFNKLVLRKDVPFGPPKISSTSPEFLGGKNWVPLFFHSGSMKVSEGLTFIKIIRLFGKFFRFFFATPKIFFVHKQDEQKSPSVSFRLPVHLGAHQKSECPRPTMPKELAGRRALVRGAL